MTRVVQKTAAMESDLYTNNIENYGLLLGLRFVWSAMVESRRDYQDVYVGTAFARAFTRVCQKESPAKNT